MEPSPKRLYRSTSNKMIAGVCGGIAEYLNVDPVVVRIAWILLSIIPLVPGIIIYLIAWLIIPKAPEGAVPDGKPAGNNAAAVLGVLFIVIGGLTFLGNTDILDWRDWWDISWEFIFPLLLVAIGVFLMARPARVATDAPGAAETGGRRSSRKASSGPAFGPALRRSKTERRIGGVCSGLADYFGIDVSIVRVAFVFFTLWPFGLGAVVYVIMMLVVPEEEAPASTKA